MMKKKLLLCVGFLVVLPCFASALKFNQKSPIHQQNYAHHVRLIKNYADIYSATLLTPISIDQKDHGSWDMTFKPEKFDIARFASGFNSEGHDVILDFFLDQIEERGSFDLIDHPLVVPIWVFRDSNFSFNDWVRAVQSSSHTAEKLKNYSSVIPKTKIGDRGDISLSYCLNNGFPQVVISSAGLSDHQSEIEKYALNVKLPPFPVPVPPPLPRLSVNDQMGGDRNINVIVKMKNAKLPPFPVPVPPPLPRLSTDEVVKLLMNGEGTSAIEMNTRGAKILMPVSVKSNDENKLPLVFWGTSSTPLSAWSVISHGEMQGKNLYSELYFIVLRPLVTPEKQEFFKKHLEEYQSEQGIVNIIKSVPSHERDYYMDGWYDDGTEECEPESIVETALVIPVH